MELKRTTNNQNNLEKNKTRDLTLSDFKIYYTYFVSKIIWVLI